MVDEDGYVLEPTDSGEWKRSKNFTLADLLRVPHEIRKLPWRPKAGWIYRNCEEAETALPIVARELGVKYAYKKLY